jgi:predicted metal-dependent phosphoesterase TrpH
MKRIHDLHSHSTASDGTLTPSELVTHAIGQGVDVLALTDHDTTEGLAEAARAAAGQGLELVNGVEISVTWSRMTVHVVGLGVDPDNEALQEGLARLREFRDWRAQEIGRRLQAAGIEGAWEGALRFSNGRLISRTHFARFLVETGHAKDVRDVFKRFLVRNRPGHVAGQWASLDEAVGWICAAGGQAVVAHPARYRMTRTKLLKLFGDFKDCGGAAIEVVSGSHSRDEVMTMARHAETCGLMASAGSDYHGPENPWVEMGRLAALPDNVVPVWQAWQTGGKIAV